MMAGACGSCTACCKVYAIPQLDKKINDWCRFCAVGSGCMIYEARPKVCIEYKCLWLESQSQEDPRTRMAPELRPDKCKVVFGPTTNERIISATTMPGTPDAWKKRVVREIIDVIVKGNMNVAIGPPGATNLLMINKYGQKYVEMTPPDKDGMQWNVKKETL